MIPFMSVPADKYEATRTVVETIKSFDAKEQEMIFRWAAESLGLPQPFGATSVAPHAAPSQTGAVISPVAPVHSAAQANAGSGQDIKSFVAAKSPRSDVQFAATIAYYYQFLAPEAEKKTSITQEDLLDACRRVDWQRPAKPYLTLNNAFHSGLLDRPEKGAFSINSVGENLVAMTLPGDTSTTGTKRRVTKKAPPKVAKKVSKKAGKKASAKAKA